MKKVKSILSFIILCIAMMAMTINVNAAVKVNAGKAAAVTVGKTTTLKVTGTKKKVKWSSANKSIATVTNKGVVKGIKPGTTTIRAKIGTKVYKCKVTVKSNVATYSLKDHMWYGLEPSFAISKMYYKNGKLVCEGVWGNPTNTNYTKLVYDAKVCYGTKVIAKGRFTWTGIFHSGTTMSDKLVFDAGEFTKGLDLRKMTNISNSITIYY